MKNSIIFICIVIAAISCKKVETPQDFGQEFFVPEVGKYKSFEVDSITFDAFLEKSDTFHYFVRETIDKEFIDVDSVLSFLVLIEYTYDTTKKWNFKNYALYSIDNFDIFRTEHNQRMVKLTLPVKERKTWDENAFNIMDEQINKYRDVGDEFEVNGLIFANTLRVDQGEDIDPFFTFKAEEMYAEKIGLIQKVLINTETQPDAFPQGVSYSKKLYETNW